MHHLSHFGPTFFPQRARPPLNIDKLKDKARKLELKDQPQKAIAVYLEILNALEGTPEIDNELSIYNKVGDLYLKTSDVNGAVEMYERAANRYAESGYPNNAIALCNKILRNAPGRTPIYLKLGDLMLQRGFVAEAKQNFIEYAERMSKAGKVEDAFRALAKVADETPDNDEIREMLAEQLKVASKDNEDLAALYQEFFDDSPEAKQRRTGRHSAVTEEPTAEDVNEVAARDLVFIDLDEEAAASAAEEESPPPAPIEIETTSLADEDAGDLPEPEPIEDLGIETTSLAEDEPAAETPSADSGLAIERASEDVDFDASGDIPALEGLDTSAEFEADDTPDDTSLEEVDLDEVELPTGAEASPQAAATTEEAEDASELFDIPDLEVEATEAAPAPAAASGSGELDVPDLDLEAFGDTADEIEVPVEEDLALPEPTLEDAATPESSALEQRVSNAESLDVPQLSDLQTAGTLEADYEPEPPTLDELELRAEESPDDPGARRDLAEALLEGGDRDRGLQELDATITAYEGREEWERAQGVAEEILRIDPNSIAHLQKRVEYSYRRGEHGQLIPAYLDLANALFRSGALDQAQAVFERVLEMDADNAAAQEGMAMIMPQGPADGEVAAAASETPDAEDAPAPAASGAGFVDLGEFILGEGDETKDTRMRGKDQQSGDEQRDFDEMLSQFKKGIEANIDEADAQAHYDLGVAFKEMGLLDEAIAEFQKALRSADTRLRSAEALGLCFFEKNQFQVAATVLRRAVDSDPSGDQEKIGLLYWLGRCEEQQTQAAKALEYYQRVFAVDIHFQDVGQRVSELAKAES